jgi:hypothetical protein
MLRGAAFFAPPDISSYHFVLQDYILDIYLQQTWQDKRLTFNGTNRITLSQSTHRQIWWPDTYFYNAKGGHQHRITTANEFVHLSPDGTVSTSQRYVSLSA